MKIRYVLERCPGGDPVVWVTGDSTLLGPLPRHPHDDPIRYDWGPVPVSQREEATAIRLGGIALARDLLWHVLKREPHMSIVRDFYEQNVEWCSSEGGEFFETEIRFWVDTWRLEDHGPDAFVTVADERTYREALVSDETLALPEGFR